MATPRSRLLRGVDFREYGAKIENIYTLVCGPQDVSLGIKKLKKSVSLHCPFKMAKDSPPKKWKPVEAL